MCVSLSPPPPPSLTADYESREFQLTFEPMLPQGCMGCETECVDITLTDDSTTEPQETFSVALTAVSDFATVDGISSSVVVVNDDDC